MNNKPISSKPQQPSKYARNALLHSDAKKFIDAAARRAMEDWQNQNPGERGHLRLKPNNILYKPSAVSFYKVLPEIVDRMVFPLPAAIKKTQREILAEVQQLFPEAKLNLNLWNRPLLPAAKKKAQERIYGNMVKPVNIQGCKTLADIRKLIKATYTTDDAETHKVTFTFMKDQLIVGKKIYPYVARQSGKNKWYFVQVPIKNKGVSKRVWVRVGALRTLARK